MTWSSSNEALATVSATGLVTGVAQGGPVTITATSETQSGNTVLSVTPPLSLSKIVAGQHHVCGLTAAGVAYCWGYNRNGELGDGTKTSRSIPVLVAGNQVFDQIAPGGVQSCALTAAGETEQNCERGDPEFSHGHVPHGVLTSGSSMKLAWVGAW